MAILTAAAFAALATQCAPDVHPKTLAAIVKKESDFNPWAIGVVDGALSKQPQTLEEAIHAFNDLLKRGENFSVGLAQVNRYNIDVKNPALAFEPCTNLKVAAKNLQACYARYVGAPGTEQSALHKALSCYYSGNDRRGFVAEPAFGGTSYVERVIAAADTLKVPALSGEADTNPSSAPPKPQPTYESWDVLRQYPRYEQPKSPAPSREKPMQHDDEDKEHTDV